MACCLRLKYKLILTRVKHGNPLIEYMYRQNLTPKRSYFGSAGKYRTAVVTSTGDVYMWEGWSKATEAILSKRVMSTLGTSPQEDLPPEWEVSKAVKQRKSGTSLAFQLITPQRSVTGQFHTPGLLASLGLFPQSTALLDNTASAGNISVLTRICFRS